MYKLYLLRNNFLRLCILKVTQQSEKHLDKVLNVDEFLKRIYSVIHSNDPVARAITVRWYICIYFCYIQYLPMYKFAKSRPGGSVAHWPSPDFPQFFCLAVSPRACTDLHLVWACRIDDCDSYYFNNHLNPFWSFLSLLVVKWKMFSFSVYSSVDRTRYRGSVLSNYSND